MFYLVDALSIFALTRCPSLHAALGLIPSLLSTIISLVRLMEEIVSNYPVEGPIMLLTFVGYKLMMRRASHLHSIKLIELEAMGWIAVMRAGFCYRMDNDDLSRTIHLTGLLINSYLITSKKWQVAVLLKEAAVFFLMKGALSLWMFWGDLW